MIHQGPGAGPDKKGIMVMPGLSGAMSGDVSQDQERGRTDKLCWDFENKTMFDCLTALRTAGGLEECWKIT